MPMLGQLMMIMFIMGPTYQSLGLQELADVQTQIGNQHIMQEITRTA